MDSAKLPGKAQEAADKTARTAGETAQKAATNDLSQNLARLGYAAKGLVYIIIGGLAAAFAFGSGGETTDSKGALRVIHEQPLGKVLLAIVAVGLFGYALWNLLKAAADTENKGKDLKGVVLRLSYIVVAFSYGLLAFTSLQLVLGQGGGGGNSDNTAKDWTARLLGAPFGVFLVIAAGLVALGVAGGQFYQAYRLSPLRHLEQWELSGNQRTWVKWLCRAGLAARGVVFGLVGLFLIMAALKENPQEARGLGGALLELARQPYGPLLLGLVAFGLILYGLYSLVEARFHRLYEKPSR